MVKLFVAFLSLILFCSMASAIVIEEYDPDIDAPPIGSDAQGENINTAIIKDYMDQKIEQLSKDAEQKVDEKITEFNSGLITLMERAYSKIGVGVITLCLWLLQMFLGYKMFFDRPQTNHAPIKKEKKIIEKTKIDKTIIKLEDEHQKELELEKDKIQDLENRLENFEKLQTIMLEKQNNMKEGLKTMFGGDKNNPD